MGTSKAFDKMWHNGNSFQANPKQDVSEFTQPLARPFT